MTHSNLSIHAPIDTGSKTKREAINLIDSIPSLTLAHLSNQS